MRFSRFSLVAACAASAVLVAGCGTVHAQAGGSQPVSLAAAVSRTQDQTARIAITIATQMQGMSVSYTENGEYDFAHSRGMISMQSPLDMTEIFIPPTTYLKLPADIIDGDGSGGAAGGSALPKGKSWIALPDGLGADPVGAFGLLGSGGGGNDPAGLLAALTAVSAGLTKLGPSVIRGVPVTGFALKIDPAKAGAVPGSDRPAVEALLKSSGKTTIPVDVWVDGRNLVRREELTLVPPGGSGAPAGAKLTLTTDFYDFGVPVTVSAPPAAEVATEPQGFMASGSSVSEASGSSGSGSGSAAAPPPPTSGTLTAAQTAGAEQAVSAFWTALGANNIAAVSATVLPAQQSCVQSGFGASSGAPTITVSGLHITSARAAADSGATVLFSVNANATLGGQDVPVFPQGPGSTQWLATTEVAGHWYVNLDDSTSFAFGGGCP